MVQVTIPGSTNFRELYEERIRNHTTSQGCKPEGTRGIGLTFFIIH
jgi:hypothetical protein